MKRTFKCLDEAFNLPHSNIHDFEEDINYTKSSNIRFNKKKKNIGNITAKSQILRIIRNEEIYYQKQKVTYKFDIEWYIDNFIKELVREQKEYYSTISKSEYQLIRERFIIFIESLDKDIKSPLRNLEEDLTKFKNNHIELQKTEKIKKQICDQKSKIISKVTQPSYSKLKASSWRF